MTSPSERPIWEWNVYQRVHGIMSELDYIAKGDKTVNGQYRFTSHDQVTAKIHPMLVKYRLDMTPSLIDIHQDGNRTSVRLKVIFTNIDTPTEQITIVMPGYGIDGGGFDRDGKEKPQGDKGPGKAISYAFKYAALKKFCLETGDDPDNDANAVYEPAKCLDFDSVAMQCNLTSPTQVKKLDEYIRISAEATGRHIEDMKREAVKNKDAFVNAFTAWMKKDKGNK